MELPPTFDITFIAGDTVYFEVEVRDPDPNDPNLQAQIPRDLTGWSAAAQVRKAAGAEELLADFTIGAMDAAGVIPLTLPPAVSQTLGPVTSAVWDLQLTSPTGEVSTILRGAVKPVMDVTRSV